MTGSRGKAATPSLGSAVDGRGAIEVAELPGNTRSWIEVDHRAIRRNVVALREALAPGVRLMGVVKADGYGHGCVGVARTMLKAGAEALAVATVEEGVQLRDAGLEAEVLVLGYTMGREAVCTGLARRLTLTICSMDHLREIRGHLRASHGAGGAAGRALRGHVKIDTGMTRLGASSSDGADLCAAVAGDPAFELAGVYSHLAKADETDLEHARQQKRIFDRVLCDLAERGVPSGLRHIANSAATLARAEFHCDMVRVGLALYGVHPAPHLARIAGLEPVLSLKSRLTQVRDVPTGTGVGYGSTYVAQRAMRIGVIPVGYGDGVPVILSGRINGMIRGMFAHQIGRVTMDQMMADVTHVAGAAPGDEVVLIGKQGSLAVGVEEWAMQMGSIPWEVLCLFKARLPRWDRY